MLRRKRRAPFDSGTVLLVARDPQVIAAARAAARSLQGAPTVRLTTREDALAQLVGPGLGPRHLVLEGDEAMPLGAAMLSAAADRFSGTGVVVVAKDGHPSPAGLRTVRAEPASLLRAMLAVEPTVRPDSGPEALAQGMTRGEITVRFQPMVRMADRQPVMLEALARWERPDAALGAGAFVAMAERAGLGAQLTVAVARRALTELAAVDVGRQLRLSFNIPLAVLLQPSLPVWLGKAVREAGLRPADLLLELTESTAVRDRSLLRRALLRLDLAGFGVLMDDLALHDGRRRRLELPFAGVKLDRGLVIAMPDSFSARAEVRRAVAIARSKGMVVIAEGVADPHVWRAALAAGCDLAQGFGVGRPLPATALSAWLAAWRQAALPPRPRDDDAG
jgi:EAL domain-containing protein (putative c-di-GMP-specific phosphodiesterase class I)